MLVSEHDSATNNDTMDGSIQKSFENLGVDWDSTNYAVKCSCHQFGLVVNAAMGALGLPKGPRLDIPQITLTLNDTLEEGDVAESTACVDNEDLSTSESEIEDKDPDDDSENDTHENQNEKMSLQLLLNRIRVAKKRWKIHVRFD